MLNASRLFIGDKQYSWYETEQLKEYIDEGATDELEQYELDDHVGEIPQKFARQFRNVCLFIFYLAVR